MLSVGWVALWGVHYEMAWRTACFMSLNSLPYFYLELHKSAECLLLHLCCSGLCRNQTLGLSNYYRLLILMSPKELRANNVNFIHFSFRQHKLYNKELYADFIAAQIKTLSFLAYIIRIYQVSSLIFVLSQIFCDIIYMQKRSPFVCKQLYELPDAYSW